MQFRQLVSLLVLIVLGSAAGSATVDQVDWPQWRGPNRNDLSRETGLLKAWPASGPAVVWSLTTLGEGYGSVAIKGDRLFVQGTKDGSSVVYCLNRGDGKNIWMASLGRALQESRGNGPRGTPTVDGDRVYALSESGDLGCLRANDGSVIWRRNILSDFKGDNPHWLISESPLIDGANVIVTPGGPGATIVALDKTTGKTVWTTKELSDGAGYSSCLVADVQGVRTIIGFTDRAGVGVRATDGKLLWSYQPVSNRTANITTPLFNDNKVFYTSAYGTGCALLNLSAQGGEVKADEVYFSREMQNHHGGVILLNGYVYGFSGSLLACVEFATGKPVWKHRSVGKGTVTYADGNLYLLSEENVVGLAEATPEGYKEKGRFSIADQGKPSWAHPVVCGGRLFVRNQGVLGCYDIRAR